MRIGDFAQACGTKISVLRHYDKLGLLKPLYIDRFTEYRYYDRSQIIIYERISELKAVGFTLKEIRTILYGGKDTEELFSVRKAALEQQLSDLEKLRQNGD
jgi:DNA-binding transcriptional MerR regulator